MTTDHWTKARVVDLLRYKQERSQQRLPYGDTGSKDPGLHAQTGLKVPKPTLALIRPFRQLTAREVGHRQRMAEFLSKESQKAEGRSQR